LAGLLVWLLWPSAPARVAPTDREYRAQTACLLTDDHGVGEGVALAVWSAMQDASVQTLVKVQFQAVVGPQTEANAIPYLNGLVLSGCGLVIGVGEAPSAAVLARAPALSNVRFAVVGGDASGIPNVTVVVDDSSQIQANVRNLVASMV
jgi:hypothetical protein